MSPSLLAMDSLGALRGTDWCVQMLLRERKAPGPDWMPCRQEAGGRGHLTQEMARGKAA